MDFKQLARDAGCDGDLPDAVVDALQVAGLLVTDLHKRALKACEQYCLAFPGIPPSNCAELIRVGRESLAAKEAAKPKPRYEATRNEGSNILAWCVEDDGIRKWPFTTEAQAHAVANALNALEAKP